MSSVASPAPDREWLLRLRGIHKHFPGVHALKGIDLDVRPGEVHAVVGENGAGKSTLMQILAGVYRPDAGRIDFDGQEGVAFPDERAARDRGIALVFQERSLFGPLSVAENVFAARQPTARWGKIDRAELAARTGRLLDEVGLAVPADRPVERLSPAQQQLVEIAKALSLDPRLILFDEPTAALTPEETERLFGIIRRLRERGVGVIYISHRLEEVFSIADRVTVLKDGAGQGTIDRAGLTPAGLIARMVGRGVNPHSPPPDPVDRRGGVVLEVVGPGRLSAGPPARGSKTSASASGPARSSAWPGWSGAGRTELALALFGARGGIDRRGPGRRPAGGLPVPRRRDRRRDRLSPGRPQGRRPLPGYEHRGERRGRRRGTVRDVVVPRPPPAPRRRGLVPLAPRRLPGAGRGGAEPERRQPAEGGPGQVAAGEPAGPDRGRADPRGRRRGQGRDPRPAVRPGPGGGGRPRHLVRPARGPGRLRPRARHARGADRRGAGPRRGDGVGGHGARLDRQGGFLVRRAPHPPSGHPLPGERGRGEDAHESR